MENEGKVQRDNRTRKICHFSGGDGGKEGVFFLLGDNHRWADRKKRSKLFKRLATDKGDVLLQGEPWRSGHREIYFSKIMNRERNEEVVVLTIDSQFLPDFIPGLGNIALESLQQCHHFWVAFFLCLTNSIRLDIPWFPEIHLSSRRDPPLNGVRGATKSSTPEWCASIFVGLIHFHSGILQHLTNTGGVSIANIKKGSVPMYVFHIDIYVRMCQE